VTLRTALPFGLGLVSLLALGLGCESATVDEPGSSTANVDEATGVIELSLRVRWNCGEYGGDGGELPADVIYDEDESEYVVETSVALGPLEACSLPYNERPADAVCGWQVPSDCWDIDVNVAPSATGAVLSVGMTAGDWDTSGGQSLPVASVPVDGPWSIDFSPDNASGAWGHVSMELQRVGADADCCVGCTVGKPCGNTCIEATLECHQPTGCACSAQ
jgi:hypothetical protein